MLYEMRIYTAAPGKLPALHERFRRHTLRFFERHGIRSVGYWTSVIGPNNNQLIYILAWESLAEREKHWNKFAADPEWLKVKEESEVDGPLVTSFSNMIMAPTDYSPMG